MSLGQPPVGPGTIDLSVVVLNYNTCAALRACLESLQREGSTTFSSPDAAITAEVHVVDNASPDDSADMVAAEFPHVLLTRAPRNGGFAYGNNLALSQAKGRAILLLNPDTLVEPGTLGRLSADLDAHPEAGAIGPKLLRADGSMHLACRRSFPTPEISLYRMLGLSARFPHSRRFARYNLTFLDPDLPTEVDSVCGACMLVRREAIHQVGLLDERFFMYGEDLDWCLRMKQRGWTIRYQPDVVVHHQHGGASRQRPLRTTIHFFRAMDLFYRMHYVRRFIPVVSGAVLTGIYAGLGMSLARLLLKPASQRRVSV